MLTGRLRDTLYDILIKFGVPKKLVRLIKICLDGTQSKFSKFSSGPHSDSS